jgi:hypothetical protein
VEAVLAFHLAATSAAAYTGANYRRLAILALVNHHFMGS